MGGKDNCFGLLPSDTRIRYGNKRVEVTFAGFTVNKGLLTGLQIALEHHSAYSRIGLDVNAIAMPDSLNQHMIENLCLLAVIFAAVFM
jgi:hypothetical protein